MPTASDYSATLTEFALRDYLRTVPDVRAAVGNDNRRIDLDFNGTGNYLVLYRAGGAPDDLLPWDRALITLHCFGTTRHAAELLRVALTKALRSLSNTPLNANVHGVGATVEGVAWLPTTDDRPRYIVTSLVTARQAATAA